MSDTIELTNLCVTRYVGPASLLDRRRVSVMDLECTGKELDLSLREAQELAFALLRAVGDDGPPIDYADKVSKQHRRRAGS